MFSNVWKYEPFKRIGEEYASKKREIVTVVIILIIQTIVFIVSGINKSYIHMDEAYSFGLANYNKIEI